MGVWTLMVTIGVPIAPFIFGFVVLRVGYRWIYWILAITNGVQFIIYFFLGSESLYLRNDKAPRQVTSVAESIYKFRRIDPTPPALLGLYPAFELFH